MYFAYKCSVGFSLFRTAFALISARSPQLSRVAPRRAKNASGDLSSTVFMNTQSFLHHACRRPVPAACEAAQHRAIGTRIHIPFYLISIFRPTIRRDGVRIELVAGNAQQSCRFCRRPRSSHLQRADPSRLRYHEASNPGSYIGRVARTSASRRVLSDSSEAHGQTEIRPPRVEAISPGYLKTSLLR